MREILPNYTSAICIYTEFAAPVRDLLDHVLDALYFINRTFSIQKIDQPIKLPNLLHDLEILKQ